MGQGETLFGRAAGQQNRCDGSGLAHTGGDHVGFHELHGVVNRKPRSDGAAGRVDVQLDVPFRIFGLQKKHLRGGQVGHVIVNGRADKNNVLFQQARINIVGPLAAAGLFHHHGDQRGRLRSHTRDGEIGRVILFAVIRGIVGIFHFVV